MRGDRASIEQDKAGAAGHAMHCDLSADAGGDRAGRGVVKLGRSEVLLVEVHDIGRV